VLGEDQYTGTDLYSKYKTVMKTTAHLKVYEVLHFSMISFSTHVCVCAHAYMETPWIILCKIYTSFSFNEIRLVIK
jgi:hypothetical protein